MGFGNAVAEIEADKNLSSKRSERSEQDERRARTF